MAANKTELGPDGHLWQLWEYEDLGEIHLQRACDAEGCEKGLLLAPARFCPKCSGRGLLVREFKLASAASD